MPRETDRLRLQLLLRLLNDPASTVVRLQRRAFAGSAEHNDLGLDRLLSPESTAEEKKRQLLKAMADFVRGLGKINRVAVSGDEVRGAPALFYEFRFEFAGERVYIKTELKEDDPDVPVLIVKSVKRDDKQWRC